MTNLIEGNPEEKTFEVTYFECYSDTYTVKAATKEEGEEKIRNMIYKGELKGPDNCYDSGFESVREIKEEKTERRL